MTSYQALLLGAIQGVTEFLPISSSGHLFVFKYLFNLGEIPLLFDALLHVATLAAVIFFFRHRIGNIIALFWRVIRQKSGKNDREGRRDIVMLSIATVCTGISAISIYLVIQKPTLGIVGIGFVITAVSLIAARRYGHARRAGDRQAARRGDIPERWALYAALIGVAQGLASLPGISRSGITISIACLCGFHRSKAGEFSLLLSIPAIAGAMALTGIQYASGVEGAGTIDAMAVVIGVCAAFVVGFGSIKLLFSLLRSDNLVWFAPYLIVIGIGATLYATIA